MSAPFASPFDPSSRRQAVYAYLAPLLAGRRVLEVGSGDGAGAERLLELGAASVLGVDIDAEAIARARGRARQTGLEFRVFDRRALESAGGFDVVIVPDGAVHLRAGTGLGPAALRGLCGPGGQLIVLVENGDRVPGRGAVGYYDLSEALTGLFPSLRLFGLTPFAAFGLAEFSETPAGLRIDGSLAAENEAPSHYLALAGADDDVDLGYALMQIPAETSALVPAAPVRAAAALADPDLRQRLAEAEGRAEGLVRVSRAQTEEIEELRARLRRGAESREELDQEVTRLRRALAEADASVFDLTRRTTQEMASLAQRITAGLRPEVAAAADNGAPLSRLREELRRREEELAAAESALSERDERVAGLEAERQDLAWQLSAALAAAEQEQDVGPARGPAQFDESAAQRQRELALEQYRQAAAAHLDEVGRLREALAEQSTLVAELEDGLSSSGRRLASALEETERLRRQHAETEEAERVRRSRLAEVEGTLLRLQRQTAMAATASPPAAAPNGTASAAEWDRKLQLAIAGKDAAERKAAALERELAESAAEAERKCNGLELKIGALQGQLEEANDQRGEAERRWSDALEKMVGLERALAEQSEAASDVPLLGVADGPRLEMALREVSRLRETLERAEEQLWETKGQLLLDRERMAVLENQLASAPTEPIVTEAAHQSIMNAVYKELASLETGVRVEIARLERIEKTVESFRGDDAGAEASGPAVRGTFSPIE